MGSSCSTHSKVHVFEPTVLENSPQKEYPLFAPNAKGLRQLSQYNKYPVEVKQTLENKNYVS